MKIYKFAISFIVMCLMTSVAFACTGIQIQAQDGSVINGRTLEFGLTLNPGFLVIPRNYKLKGTLPDGNPGMDYKAKYAAFGTYIKDMGEDTVIIDGLNEKGLAAGIFYFPGYASYAQATPQHAKESLAPVEFINWVLTQFATVDEVKQALNNIVITNTPIKSWNQVPPFHYVVYDKTGKSIVIEPINGKLVVYDNPLGTITNSPAFDWQMTNLRNYINLKPTNINSITFKDLTLKPFGQGSGFIGMPGDFTPPSRFVRATIFSAAAAPVANADAGVMQVFHLLNQFDIPKGVVRGDDNGKTVDDYTMFTVARDATHLRYFIKTYDNQTIQMLRLNAFDLNSQNLSYINIATQQKFIDLSGKFQTTP